MITTTFSYDNCISTYSLVVDRSKTTRAQRWLLQRGVMVRMRFEGARTRILFHITNVSPAVVRQLTNKFGLSSLDSAPAPKPIAAAKPFLPTVFRHTTKGYELLVDNSKAIATTAWLVAAGCQFDRYISNGMTRYVFVLLPDEALTAITAKHECKYDATVKIARPVGEPTPTPTLAPAPLQTQHRTSAMDAIAQALVLEDTRLTPSKLTRNVYLKLLHGTELDAQAWIDGTFSQATFEAGSIPASKLAPRANRARRIQNDEYVIADAIAS